MLLDPEVKSDAERLRWDFVPFISVGPLHFGMSRDQVIDALSAGKPTYGEGSTASGFDFFYEGGVTVYYSAQGELACAAVDPFQGPLVFIGGFQLTHRLPSEIEAWMRRGEAWEFRLNRRCEPTFEEVGLVIRGKQGGDLIRSRPVFVSREWAAGFANEDGGFIPLREWQE
ncbi:hypothetical protein ACFYOF_21035 [Streptomyces sp. NPDC007148]|uniref:hypothetical protein n=1 Tax=Streptomyces sp. NPDC007148 TaxID=3364775 RepID=UPI003696E34B